MKYRIYSKFGPGSGHEEIEADTLEMDSGKAIFHTRDKDGRNIKLKAVYGNFWKIEIIED